MKNYQEIRAIFMVSVVTVVFNGEQFLDPTIMSAYDQISCEKEIIVVDGGSVDGTLNIIKKYHDKIDYWVSEPDKGIYDAMNKGIRAAQGDWVVFMNAGDTFASLDVLSKIDFPSYKNFAIIYGNTVQNDGEIQKPTPIDSIRHGGIMACHQSMFFNKALLGDELIYDDSYRLSGDSDLVIKLYSKNFPMKYLDIEIAWSLGGGVGVREGKIFKNRVEPYRIIYTRLGLVAVIRAFVVRMGARVKRKVKKL